MMWAPLGRSTTSSAMTLTGEHPPTPHSGLLPLTWPRTLLVPRRTVPLWPGNWAGSQNSWALMLV